MIFEIMLSFLCLLYDANVQYIPAHTVNSRETKNLSKPRGKWNFMAFGYIYSARNEFNVDCFYS